MFERTASGRLFVVVFVFFCFVFKREGETLLEFFAFFFFID